jgi:hypothetical protein
MGQLVPLRLGDQRMLTASGDQTVRLWDVETAVGGRHNLNPDDP